MGAIVCSIQDFYDETSEIVGLKSGLLLNDYTVNSLLKEKFEDDFLDSEKNTQSIRIRSEEIEAMIRYIRVRIGNLREESNIVYSRTLAKYLTKAEDFRLYYQYINYALHQQYEGKELTYDLLFELISQDKERPQELVEALIYSILERVDENIWLPVSKSLEGSIPLQSLFEVEVFPLSENTFIDQRFIDYLAVNGNEIEEIHWRNFERFIAEYFQRQKFTVLLGPGTKDGGIDIRIFNEIEAKEPFILIQCKRYKSEHKVSVESIKAFYSDVEFEKAKFGLIATTSQITSGGKKLVSARDYNISFVEKKRVKEWATAMWKNN